MAIVPIAFTRGGTWGFTPVTYRKNKRLFRQTEAYWQSSELSNTGILGLESGTFRAIQRTDAPNCETVWHLARVTVKGDYRLREINRMGWGTGWKSGHW
jgi:hypothetical protein